MAETACFILIDGEMLIEEHQLSQRMDLSLTIERGLVHLEECVGLNAVDVSDDLGNLLLETCGHATAKVASRSNGCDMSLISPTGQ